MRKRSRRSKKKKTVKKKKRRKVMSQKIDDVSFECWGHVCSYLRRFKDFYSVVMTIRGLYVFLKDGKSRNATENVEFHLRKVPKKRRKLVQYLSDRGYSKKEEYRLSRLFPNLRVLYRSVTYEKALKQIKYYRRMFQHLEKLEVLEIEFEKVFLYSYQGRNVKYGEMKTVIDILPQMKLKVRKLPKLRSVKLCGRGFNEFSVQFGEDVKKIDTFEVTNCVIKDKGIKNLLIEFQQMKNLRRLSITDIGKFDVSKMKISKLHALEFLDIQGKKIYSWGRKKKKIELMEYSGELWVNELPKLQTFTFKYMKINLKMNFSEFSCLENVEIIHWKSSQLGFIDWDFSKNKKLRRLIVSKTENRFHFVEIKKLVNLKKLSRLECNHGQVNGLEKLPALKSLIIDPHKSLQLKKLPLLEKIEFVDVGGDVVDRYSKILRPLRSSLKKLTFKVSKGFYQKKLDFRQTDFSSLEFLDISSSKYLFFRTLLIKLKNLEILKLKIIEKDLEEMPFPKIKVYSPQLKELYIGTNFKHNKIELSLSENHEDDVGIERIELTGGAVSINKKSKIRFPKLKKMNLLDCIIKNVKFDGETFPSLEHLSVCTSNKEFNLGIDKIDGMRSLKYLRLCGVRIGELGSLNSLKNLEFTPQRSIVDISHYNSLESIHFRWGSLPGSKYPTDCISIHDNPRLKEVKGTGANRWDKNQYKKVIVNGVDIYRSREHVYRDDL